MKIEVVVASLNKTKELIEQMNLSTCATIANQTNSNSKEEYIYKGNRIKIVNTDSRGVGINRNIGIMNIEHDTDILLFSDDDIVYEDNYKELVEEAFEKNMTADIIIFELDYVEKSRATYTKLYKKRYKKLSIFNALKYGAPRIAIRRDSLYKSNIWFSLLYGGGAPISAGEDVLFIVESFRKDLKVYKCSDCIAKVYQGESTWFNGYTDKFFYDKGLWLANAFPYAKYLLMLYFSYRFSKISDKDIFFVFKNIYKGIKEFKSKSFSSFIK